MPAAYDRLLAPAVFGPFAADLAVRAARRDPGRILEVAAGTGVLTRELIAALPSAEVTATDLNPAMVSYGSGRVPEARWEQADAERLRYPDGRFDLVACQFGVMFLPDKPGAFAEARRVLRPGGAFVLNTWDTVDTHGFASALVAGLELAFPGDPPAFLVSVPHGYADRSTVVEDLAAGGFRSVHAETVILEGRSESARQVAVGFCTGTPLRAAIAARADLAEVVATVSEEMVRRLGSGPVSVRMTAHVFEACAEV